MAKLSSVQQFGENFLAVIQDIQKRKQDQEEFNRTMQFQKRQMNLLNTRFLTEQDRLKSQFEATHGLDVQKEATDIEQFKQTQELKGRNLLEGVRQFDVSQETKKRQQDITAGYYGQLGKQFEKTLKFKYDELGVKQTLAKLKADTDKTGDVTRSRYISKLVGDINFRIEGGGEESEKALRGNIEELMDFTNLKQESKSIKESLKAGVDINKAIEFINADRKSAGAPPLTQDEVKYLKLFGLAEEELDDGFLFF